MAQPHHIARRHNTGFTLLELLVALALMGMLAAWGLPSFQALGERSAVASEVNRLQTALTLARNTAITQRSDVTVCPANEGRTACTGDWNGPIMVVKGDKRLEDQVNEVIRVFASTAGTIVTKSGAPTMRYTSLGSIKGSQGTYTVCPTNDQAQASCQSLVLSPAGRARID